MKDTAVGRYEQTQKIVMREIAKKMSAEDKMEFIRDIMGEEAAAATAEDAEPGDSDLSTIFVDPYAPK